MLTCGLPQTSCLTHSYGRSLTLICLSHRPSYRFFPHRGPLLPLPCTHLTCRMITMLRGVLVSAMFKKPLGLEYSQAKESAAVTRISPHTDGIENGLTIFHDIWAGIIELGLGIDLLAAMAGGASFLVVLSGLDGLSEQLKP